MFVVWFISFVGVFSSGWRIMGLMFVFWGVVIVFRSIDNWLE